MKIFQFVLVVTVVVATVAFPTPQEVKPVSETKEQNEHVPMVQKIEIHVEVKAVPVDMMIPALVTVTEVKEHIEKSTEAVKAVVSEKVPEVVKSADVKSLESMESSEVVKSVEVAKPVESMKPSVDTKEAEAVKEATKVDYSTTKAADVKKVEIIEKAQVKAEEVKPVIESVPGKNDQLVEATSEPKPAIVEAPMEKSVKPEPENVEAKAEAAKPVQVEAAVAKIIVPQAVDDSDEDNSSEEKPSNDMVIKLKGEPVRASPVITFDEAVKETTMESTKEQAMTVMPEVQADEITKVDKEVTAVKPKPEAKSISNEMVVPIVEDLPKEKQSVEAEPVYKTIPVAVVHDEPIKEEIKKVAVKTVETVEVAEQNKEEIPAVKPTEATTANADVEKPTVQAEVESTTAGEVQKEDAPIVKTVDTIQTVADPVTVASSPAESVEAKSEKLEEPNVLVVEAIKAVDLKESEPAVQTTAEPTKETEVKAIESVKKEGSSTKATEATENKVEDSSVSSSTATKTTEDVAKAIEVTEKAEEVTTEVSTTTTTTAAPVQVEGKKGKKKLPGSNKKQNTI
ncbi:nucleolar and coiled-body phosphoprotein 1-like isoform X2 [Ochlerotatus camptorhynchus]|uniref:nucleolar and coiled-body phosphoprotein 1-like isoform X2 n=1 Tax=Ochlerotatus camptorhynchus TaxID=644619 RepID=UPI0031E20865